MKPPKGLVIRNPSGRRYFVWDGTVYRRSSARVVVVDIRSALGAHVLYDERGRRRTHRAIVDEHATTLDDSELDAILADQFPKLDEETRRRLENPPLPFERMLAKRFGDDSTPLSKREARALRVWLDSRGWLYSEQYREWAIPGDETDGVPFYGWPLAHAANIQATNDALALIETRGWEVAGGGGRDGWYISVSDVKRVHGGKGTYRSLIGALTKEGFVRGP